MNTIAIIQARLGSSRLPGKVLEDLCGQSVLAWVVSRVRRAKGLDSVVVATTNEALDDAIVRECAKLDVDVFRGDEQDVLDRFYRAAQWKRASTVVRITADCPLIDPAITDTTISTFLAEQPDYASNTLERTYPRGLDTEVISLGALERAWKEAREPHQRAHVTPYLYQNPQLFRLVSVKGDVDYSADRWTLDTAEDLKFLRAVCDRFSGQVEMTWVDVLALLEREPSLRHINNKVSQKTLHES
jgi:spore coat polysaccharide biosynthesis protein SpsF